MSAALRELIAEGSFQGYAYAYPHKTAYRPFDQPIPLKDLWAEEDRTALFLYAHVPFCEMRCGFCNLFTMTHPSGGIVNAYLDALERQGEAVGEAIGNSSRVARLALGGGTPTFLTIGELERLFGVLNGFPGMTGQIPKAIEASPATIDAEKIDLFRKQGITRVSLGVQSFIESEVHSLGRSQRTHEVRRALGILTEASFPCVNIDLIYGIDGQTAQTWHRSLEEALEFAPQEIYLYPLYVRPLTGLDKRPITDSDNRMELYLAGRSNLLSHGYRQVSMRLFRRSSYIPAEGPIYCCQEDGMIGLGAGARSYTRAVHYSTEYAVGRAGVMEVVADFNSRTREQFSFAHYGFQLDLDEQKRRYVLKSLLRADGLKFADYGNYCGSDPFEDLPQLAELLIEGLAERRDGTLVLTAEGLALSDVIGPWLWSDAVRGRMGEFALR